MKDSQIVDILLVEDNPHDAELTIRALKKRNISEHIYVVENGVDALEFVFGSGKFALRDSSIIPKVIFLDLKLPKVNGLEVLRTIKNHFQTSSIPIVMVTSSAEASDIQAAYDLGVNSYVVKPVDFDHFSEAMSNLGSYWLSINQPPA